MATGVAFQIVDERINHRLAGARKNSKGVLGIIDNVGVGDGEAAGIEHRDTLASGAVPSRFEVHNNAGNFAWHHRS